MQGKTKELATTTPLLPSWIESFIQLTEPLDTPPRFRIWCGLACIAGSLENRTWVKLRGRKLYPNLYTCLVGPSAAGKSTGIDVVERLWHKVGTLNIAAAASTRAAAVDQLHVAAKYAKKGAVRPPKLLPENGVIYNAMAWAVKEFGVLASKFDPDLFSFMCDLYDCPSDYVESRRTQGEDKVIINPCLNFITGTTPSFYSHVFFGDKSLTAMGICSRMPVIYAEGQKRAVLFDEVEPEVIYETDLFKQLARDLELFTSQVHGEFTLSPAAKEWLNAWWSAGCLPAAPVTRIEDYPGRRHLLLLKLAMVLTISNTYQMTIEPDALTLALSIMVDMEAAMPGAFQGAHPASDSIIVQDVIEFVKSRQDKNLFVRETQLGEFLLKRMQSWKIKNFILQLESAGLIEKVPFTIQGKTIQYYQIPN